MEDSGTGLFGAVLAWAAHPFNSKGSAFNWILFVGLLTIAAFMWNIILIDVLKEV